MRSDELIPCFAYRNGCCRAEHPLGSFGVVNHDVTAVTLVRELNARDGLTAYLAVEYSEASTDAALTLPLGGGRALATLLTAGADLYELYRVDDAHLYSAQVTA